MNGTRARLVPPFSRFFLEKIFSRRRFGAKPLWDKDLSFQIFRLYPLTSHAGACIMHNMEITRISMYSGIMRSRMLDITEEQLAAYDNGVLIQNAFPNLTDEEREFFMTGITRNEWIEMFSDEEA